MKTFLFKQYLCSIFCTQTEGKKVFVTAAATVSGVVKTMLWCIWRKFAVQMPPNKIRPKYVRFHFICWQWYKHKNWYRYQCRYQYISAGVGISICICISTGLNISKSKGIDPYTDYRYQNWSRSLYWSRISTNQYQYSALLTADWHF